MSKEYWIDISLGLEHEENGSWDTQIFTEPNDTLTHVIEKSAYDTLQIRVNELEAELEQANRRAMDYKNAESYVRLQWQDEAERLKILAESYRAVLLEIVNDNDLQHEDVNGLLDKARAALGEKK